MVLSWLHLCAQDEMTPCIQPTELVYLAALLVGLAVIVVIAIRARDLTTAMLTLMPVAIAINIAVAAIVVALRLPIYLNSIGTVLVGALAGPWAGAMTGLLTDPIWAILPVPGGGGPTTAFFAPVAGVIGLLAGFWASQGVFRLRTDDPRVGRFLALWAGIAAAVIAYLAVQQAIGIPSLSVTDKDQLADNQLRFLLIAAGLVSLGLVMALVAARTVFAFRGGTARARAYLVIASATTAGAIAFVVLWLLLSPTGWFLEDRRLQPHVPVGRGPDRSRPARRQGEGSGRRGGRRRGRRRRLVGETRRERSALSGPDRRTHDRPDRCHDRGTDRCGTVRRRDRRRDGRRRRPLQVDGPECAPVDLRPGPDQRPARQDAQLHGRRRGPRRPADHGPDDVQPGRGGRRRLTGGTAPTVAGQERGVETASGYFRPGDSWLHRRNPLTKALGLLWVLLAAFLLPPPALLALAAATLLLAAGCGRLLDVLRSLRIPAVLLASILVVNALLFPGGRDVLASLGPLAVTREGVEFGVVSAGRLLVAFAASILFLQTTLPDDLLEALVSRGASHRIAYVILSAMQTVPRLQATATTILEAQQARGLAVSGSFGQRLRALVPLVGPVMLGALIEVRERTFALEARGFGARRRRTAYRVVADPPIDRWLRLGTVAGMAVVIVAAAMVR